MNPVRQRIRFARWHLFHTLPMILGHASAYPELPRKPFVRRLADNLLIYLRDGAPCAAYDGLGLDVRGRGISDFVGNHRWLKFLERDLLGAALGAATPMQRLMALSSSPLLLLQDKCCFWSHMERHGIPSVPVLAHTLGGRLYQTGGAAPLESCERVFVKPVAENCGKSAMALDVRDGRFLAAGREVSIAGLAADGDFIFQPVVVNHTAIRALNPSTLNTMRVVTCRRPDGSFELFDSGMLRIGRAGRDVDNFAQGGIGVGIGEDGRLMKYGYTHDAKLNYAKMERHPDSGLSFGGMPVPFYDESVELAKKAHSLLPSLRTIGWDVAVTDDGPVLVEGNHDWDIEMLQVVHHAGYAKRLEEVYGR